LKKYRMSRQENYIAITLSSRHEVIGVHHVTKGLMNRTLVHPREIFFHAIKDNAVGVMIAHNHPSGSVIPSPEDDAVTRELEKAGRILGFSVVDSLIITKNGFYSYAQNGGMNKEFSSKELDDYIHKIVSSKEETV